MTDHTSILSGALVDYTEWLLRQKESMIGSPAELRGIFYNKLMARLREAYSFPDLRKAVVPEDMFIVFRPPGYIVSIAFEASPSSYRPSMSKVILEALHQALLNMNVEDYHDRFSYELSKVILEAKNCFNYGRQQTPRGGSE